MRIVQRKKNNSHTYVSILSLINANLSLSIDHQAEIHEGLHDLISGIMSATTPSSDWRELLACEYYMMRAENLKNKLSEYAVDPDFELKHRFWLDAIINTNYSFRRMRFKAATIARFAFSNIDMNN